jgi:hypothetical protein
MPEQFNLDLRPREEKPDYDSMPELELRQLFKDTFGPPVPVKQADIIDALADPATYLSKREVAQNEDKDDLRQAYG